MHALFSFSCKVCEDVKRHKAAEIAFSSEKT